MNLLFVSQCHKNALKETRRVLDQYAERKGVRTWQASMTHQGQRTVHQALRRTARKNTAVACHWIKRNQEAELIWVVGRRDIFNPSGTVAIETTQRNILRSEDENNWHHGESIQLLAAMGALLHDIGKACDVFQLRLRDPEFRQRNVFRHEWISLRLFESFIRWAGPTHTDTAWLEKLAELAHDGAAWRTHLTVDESPQTSLFPFETLPPFARAVGWLIVTHHRLPQKPLTQSSSQITAADLTLPMKRLRSTWNENYTAPLPPNARDYWTFSRGLPVTDPQWQKMAQRLAQRCLKLLALHPNKDWLGDPFIMHLARLSLILGDHNGSSKQSMLPHAQSRARIFPTNPGSDRDTGLTEINFANTWRPTRTLNQSLVEHLLLISREASSVAHALPTVARNVSYLAQHKGLRRRSQLKRFRWQDKAADLAQSVRERTAAQGAFFVNMASTGAGKTLANARIMYALADPQRGARFSVALGLRTLTMQTGQAYRERLHLSEAELAILVGGVATQKLFKLYQERSEATGSESQASLMTPDEFILYESDFENDQVLKRLLRDPKPRKLLDAPVLVCTIDHLMPATESQRGGHHIPPMLRLLTSDLVLDEVDDFGLEDLPAITRLVHWAGLLGTRVMLSSATIPPAIVKSLFAAYAAGRAIFQKNALPTSVRPSIVCAWFDERDAHAEDCVSPEDYAQAHLGFVTKRVHFLATQPIRRIPNISDVSDLSMPQQGIPPAFAQHLLGQVTELHQNHHLTDADTGAKVSFGLIRMANINPIVETALALTRLPPPADTHLHLCVYHANHPLIVRSHIEHVLDTTLNRKNGNSPLNTPEVRSALRRHPSAHHIFVVLASPVAEVGRDHDYDWAIIEPSSVRSMIQLAGRIRRHRFDEITTPNVAILSHNIRALRKERPRFTRPGFEKTKGPFALKSPDLRELLEPDELQGLDSRPRVIERQELRPDQSLTDLEHARLKDLLLGEYTPAETSTKPRSRRRTRGGPSAPSLSPKMIASHWWLSQDAPLSYLMQQWQPFRQDPSTHTRFVFRFHEDEERWLFHEEFEVEKNRPVYKRAEERLKRIPDPFPGATWLSAWPETDLTTLLRQSAADGESWSEQDEIQFTQINLREPSDPTVLWEYHPSLGFFHAAKNTL